MYYSQFDSTKKLPSLLSSFFTTKFENEIFNFSIKGEEKNMATNYRYPRELTTTFRILHITMKHLNNFSYCTY